MSRRVNLPGADELFRATTPDRRIDPVDEKPESAPKEDTARVKHDEKMTVYLTSEELMALEQARLQLRTMLGRKIDRGRVVRAALAGALADLADHGEDSELFGRLSE